MNFAVGANNIADEAYAAIKVAGGHIETTLKPGVVVMVCLPAQSHILYSDNVGVIIELPDGAKLVQGRAWNTEDCTVKLWNLDLLK